MMKWWKRRIYRSDVLANVIAMTFMIGEGEGEIIEKHDGIADAIRTNFESGTPSKVAATYIAASLMAYAIEQCNDIIRKQIVEQGLSNWASLDVSEQRKMRKLLREGKLEQDMLLTRCQWLLLMGQDLLVEHKIEIQDFRILKDSIFGPLKGETLEYRSYVRIDEAIDDAFGMLS